MDNEKTIISQLLAAQGGEPLQVYRKAIRGVVIVKVIDPYTANPAELILQGELDSASPEDLEVPLYTELEVSYFQRYNRSLIESGSLVLLSEKTDVTVNFSNAMDDEAMRDVVNSPYFSLKKTVNNLTSPTALRRLLKMAEEENRPAKTLSLIKLRLEEVQ